MTASTHRSEQLIKQFYKSLLGEGMSASTAARYRDKLRFFYHAYVMEEWPRGIDRVDGEIIRDFLGAWFLRHVGGAKSDVIGFLRVFRKFYNYLYETGEISLAELGDVKMVIEARDYFEARYDDYFTPVPPPWGRNGRQRAAGARAHNLVRKFDVDLDRQLWMLIHNIHPGPYNASLDFCLFLDYILGAKVKVTKAQKLLPAKHVKAINSRFTSPERLPASPRMRSSKRVVWLFNLAKSLELIETDEKDMLLLTERADAFLDLDPEVQTAIMIDATWNQVPWSRLGSSDVARVSDWAQMNRDGFAGLLADLRPGREWPIEPETAFDGADALLSKYIYFHEVVEREILFALSECGLVEIHRFEDERVGPLDIRAISITRLGQKVMRLFYRRAESGATVEDHPLVRLEESLFPY